VSTVVIPPNRARRHPCSANVTVPLPESDSFFCYLLALGMVSDILVETFTVINGDREVLSRFQQLLGKGTARRYQAFECLFGDPIRHNNKIVLRRLQDLMTKV
jgi:hypothetical protein